MVAGGYKLEADLLVPGAWFHHCERRQPVAGFRGLAALRLAGFLLELLQAEHEKAAIENKIAHLGALGASFAGFPLFPMAMIHKPLPGHRRSPEANAWHGVGSQTWGRDH